MCRLLAVAAVLLAVVVAAVVALASAAAALAAACSADRLLRKRRRGRPSVAAVLPAVVVVTAVLVARAAAASAVVGSADRLVTGWPLCRLPRQLLLRKPRCMRSLPASVLVSLRSKVVRDLMTRGGSKSSASTAMGARCNRLFLGEPCRARASFDEATLVVGCVPRVGTTEF